MFGGVNLPAEHHEIDSKRQTHDEARTVA